MATSQEFYRSEYANLTAGVESFVGEKTTYTLKGYIDRSKKTPLILSRVEVREKGLDSNQLTPFEIQIRFNSNQQFTPIGAFLVKGVQAKLVSLGGDRFGLSVDYFQGSPSAASSPLEVKDLIWARDDNGEFYDVWFRTCEIKSRYDYYLESTKKKWEKLYKESITNYKLSSKQAHRAFRVVHLGFYEEFLSILTLLRNSSVSTRDLKQLSVEKDKRFLSLFLGCPVCNYKIVNEAARIRLEEI